MATTCVLRAITQSAQLFLGAAQRRTFYAYRCLPCVSITHNMVMSRTYSSFITTVTADQLWEGVTSVSNPGKKRGRARGLKRKIDLNRGQRIGKGPSGMVFPGLDGPALVGRQSVKIHETLNKEDQTRLPPIRRKLEKLLPLQRGYSGRKLPGTSIGPPDPINDYVFEGFDTRVLEHKMVAHMTGNLGRKSSLSVLVVTGNGKGLAGYALAKAPVGRTALRKAKNMAAQRLQYFERFNDHTVNWKKRVVKEYFVKKREDQRVFHDFAVTEHKTTLLVQKKPKGYGLVCHRVLKTICQIIGIEDIYVKTEGQTGNIQSVTKAFFRGLMEMETHQQLADRMKLNVVEYRPELDNFPVPVATPSQGFSRPDPIKEEAFDFNNLYYKNGKIPFKRQEDPLAKYKSLPSSWKYYLKMHRYRNQKEAECLRKVHGFQPSAEEIKDRLRPLK